MIPDVFGPDGLLAQRFDGYEPRPGQIKLAEAALRTLQDGGLLLAEAPCGTGKSIGYGAPAVWWAVQNAPQRVVIATANIALQEQLVKKDLPLLREVLPWDFEFALLKGRSNYLCLDSAAKAQPKGLNAAAVQQFDTIEGWVHFTRTGDVSELPFIPDPQVWGRFTTTSDNCLKDTCASWGGCLHRQAVEAAAMANIVVTNYHLLFADLQVRWATGGMVGVLPPYKTLIMDEAHEAADIARGFFERATSPSAIRSLVRRVDRLRALLPPGVGKHLPQSTTSLLMAMSSVFEAAEAYLRERPHMIRLKDPDWLDVEEAADSVYGLAEAVEAVAEPWLETRCQIAMVAKSILRTTQQTADLLHRVSELSDPNAACWIELNKRKEPKLISRPVDVGEHLQRGLWDRLRSVVLTSATMTTGPGSFDFLRRELGITRAKELVVGSPFDFRQQAMIVVPSDEMPRPTDEKAFPPAVVSAVARITEACNGRTLGLFTSWKILNVVSQAMRSEKRWRVLVQGDAPRLELLRQFREDVHSVLLGTASFWTGVDVQGEALSGVIVDRLPFPNPRDPIVDAIGERDPHAFATWSVPRTIMSLRQGVGRLIRARGDRGVVVILDKRIIEARWGEQCFDSLPPMKFTRKIDDIPKFLEASCMR